MASKTELANLMLLELGKDSITSIDDDTYAAKWVSRIWDEIRKHVLSEGYWNFAFEQQTLASTGVTPTFGFTYEFQLPADMITLIEINEEPHGTYKYRIKGDKLQLDESSVSISYIQDITNTGYWSIPFNKAFVAYGAWKLSYAFRADKQITLGLAENYERVLHRSLALDGQQGSKAQIVSNDLDEVR